MPTHTILSLREQLNGAAAEFLASEDMTCPKTRDGLVLLINALGHYREEGKELFPEVFVFDNLKNALSILPESEFVEIGIGGRTSATMAKALKKCAPLARRGWAVYIERRSAKFAYGLFRSGSTVLSLSPAELLVNRGDPAIPVFMLRQVAENVIQVNGFSRSSLLVHFGAAKSIEVSPLPKLQGFANCIVKDVPEYIQEQVASFFMQVLSGVLRAGHGTLAAVISARKRMVPKAFRRDGIVLTHSISVPARVADVLVKTDATSNARLQAAAALITGMLLSDGITIFGSDGTVRAYNVFVKSPKSAHAAVGGARTRTFKMMASLVGKDLVGALMQSQDGKVEFKGNAR
jgi:hypothetical protein